MNSSIILGFITIILLTTSFIFDKKKSISGLKKGIMMFLNLLPTLITILIIISSLLYFIPNELLLKLFGKESGLKGMILAAIVGSISLIPGFIAYPLGNILIKQGVSYSVIAIFITTLMMVGIVTLPIEKKYFGIKVALIRNSLSFIGAIVIGLLIGTLWGLL